MEKKEPQSTEDIKDCEIYIVTVPTPIDKHKRPDLTSLEKEHIKINRVWENLMQ